MPQGLSAHRAPQSQFVTVLGRIAMGFAILGVVMAVAQVLIVPTLMTMAWDGADTLMSTAQSSLLFVVGLATSSFNVFMCWAFLKRQNWARIGFLVTLGCGVLLSVLAAIGVVAFLGLVGAEIMPGGSDMQGMVSMIRFTYMALGMLAVVNAAVSVWLMVRLSAPPIRAEFGQR